MKTIIITMIITIMVIIFLKLSFKKLYFQSKIELENIMEKQIKEIESRLNEKLNRKGNLYNLETVEHLYGSPLLEKRKKIEIYIFNYGVVLLDENYKNTVFEQTVVIEKENIIQVNTLDRSEFIERYKSDNEELDISKDDIKTCYIEMKYKCEEKEKTLILSSNGKGKIDNLDYKLIKSQHDSVRMELLKISIEGLIKS